MKLLIFACLFLSLQIASARGTTKLELRSKVTVTRTAKRTVTKRIKKTVTKNMRTVIQETQSTPITPKTQVSLESHFNTITKIQRNCFKCRKAGNRIKCTAIPILSHE